jgi:ribosome-binding protein aMBF1 (putative translation factor)
MKAKQKFCDGCGELRYIWKNVVVDGERLRLCQRCAKSHQGRSAKPTSSKKQSIAPRSPKRQKQEREYSKKRKKFLEENPLCQIPVPGICTHKATEIHHVDGRVVSYPRMS